MANIIESRLRKFQKPNLANTQYKRQEFAVQLRKKKRTEAQNTYRLQKATLDTTIEILEGPTDSADEDLEQSYFNLPELIRSLDQLQDLSPDDLLASLEFLKNILSSNDAPIKTFVKGGIIPKILPYSSVIFDRNLRYLALWILCNITAATSSYIKGQITFYNLTNVFMEAISEKDEKIIENSLWGLSNLIADDEETCKVILSMGFLDKVLGILNFIRKKKIFRMIAWSLSNICHFESVLDSQMTSTVLKICEKTLEHCHPTVKKMTLAVLSVLIRKDNNKVDQFLNSQVFKKTMELWYFQDFYPELVKIASGVCSGDHVQTQKILDLGILDMIYLTLDSNDEETAYNSYFILSNIAAGRLSQLRDLQKHVVFFKALNSLYCFNEKIKVEVSYLIKNFIKQANEDMKTSLITDQFMNGIIQALEFKNPEFIINLLTVFEEFIKLKGKHEFNNKGYNTVIENLQLHRNDTIYNACEQILESY